MNESYIALGSNIEPRKQYLDKAMRLLQSRGVQIEQTSSIFETKPVGYDNQGNFLNMVIEVKTAYSAESLLDVCQAIETELGRKRTIKNGPRTIDLDILLYNEEIVQLDRLIIPHPRLHERAFVLVPLNEIAGKWMIPTVNKVVEDLLQELPKEAVLDVRKWENERSD